MHSPMGGTPQRHPQGGVIRSLSMNVKKDKKDGQSKESSIRVTRTFRKSITRKTNTSPSKLSSKNSPGSPLNIRALTASRKLSPMNVTPNLFVYGDEDNDEDESAVNASISIFERWRLEMKAFFAYSVYGHIYDWSLLVMSMISCVLFIYQQYLPLDNTFALTGVQHGAKLINSRLNKAELTFAAIFSVDFGISLFIADHRWEFLRR